MHGLRNIGFVALLVTSPVLAQVPPADIPPLPKATGTATPLLAAWTQFVNAPDGETSAAKIIQARFVMLGSEADCDTVLVEGQDPASSNVTAKMRGHLQGIDPATDKSFTITVCTADLPETWAQVYLKTKGNELLTVYPSGERAVLPGPAAMSGLSLSGIVMADTGCRGKSGVSGSRFYQDCETGWPFPQIILDAANDEPQFVLHGGDYHYFFEDESAFWDRDNGRDRFEYWLQEFLVPAQPLLMKVPWILGRGNHERCRDQRWFGEGWHVLFSNMSLEGVDKTGNTVALRPCYDADPTGNNWIAPSWAVDFVSGPVPATPPWRFVVIDSSQPLDTAPGFDKAATLTRAHGRDTFWLTHYPAVKMVYYSPTPDFGDGHIKLDAANATDCDAPYACRPRAMFTGHQHLYQEITWADPNTAAMLPRIVIVGNGGTKIDSNGLPGYAKGANAKTSLSCTQTFPDTLPGQDKSPFGFGANRKALIRTASQAGYMHIERDMKAPDNLGWVVTPKWIGNAPTFPDAAPVHCDGTPIKN